MDNIFVSSTFFRSRDRNGDFDIDIRRPWRYREPPVSVKKLGSSVPSGTHGAR